MRLDIYRSSDGFLLDLQADLLDDYRTRVVAPLLPAGSTPPPLNRLNPILDWDDGRWVLATHLLAAAPVASLGRPVGRVKGAEFDVTRALDLLFTGF
ncbi:MAG: CcdB family protein [Pseudomonadota bacterium]